MVTQGWKRPKGERGKKALLMPSVAGVGHCGELPLD